MFEYPWRMLTHPGDPAHQVRAAKVRRGAQAPHVDRAGKTVTRYGMRVSNGDGDSDGDGVVDGDGVGGDGGSGSGGGDRRGGGSTQCYRDSKST